MTRLQKKRAPPSNRKERINLTLDPEVLTWIRKRTGKGGRFASITHAVEVAVYRLMESDP